MIKKISAILLFAFFLNIFITPTVLSTEASDPTIMGGDIAAPQIRDVTIDHDSGNLKFNFTAIVSDRSGVKVFKLVWTYSDKDGEVVGELIEKIDEDASKYKGSLDLSTFLKKGERGELNYFFYAMDNAGNERRTSMKMIQVVGPQPEVESVQGDVEFEGSPPPKGTSLGKGSYKDSEGEAEGEISSFFEKFFSALINTFKAIGNGISAFFHQIKVVFGGAETSQTAT
ncbi:MAG: hypothetical protein KAS39_02365, partial [Actinomycetia bacterium]|nr:hypothetical protein [Actinomycetes bacterium]